MVFRAEQVRVGTKKEVAFDEVPTAGSQTRWANEVLSGFDSMEEIDWKELHVRGGDREPYQIIELKHTVEDSFSFALQDGLWPAYAFGDDRVDGSTPTNPTTLTAQATKGATTINVASAAGYIVNDFVNLERTTVRAEVRKITGIAALVFTLDQPISYTHASASSVDEVVTPYTHTMVPLNTMPFPSTVLELNYLDATNLSAYWRGVVIDALELSGSEGDIIMGTAGIKASRVTKNTGALSTITTDTTTPYKFSQGTFTYFGSVIARILDWRFKLNNTGKMAFYHDSTAGLFAKEYIPGKVTYELETTAIPFDTTLFDQLKTAASNLTCTILYTRGTSDTFQIQGTNCVLRTAPHPFPEDLEVPVRMSITPRNTTITHVSSNYYYV